MRKKIAIMGVGAVGGYIGAFLIRKGYDVTLIDMWAEHVNTMNGQGLCISDSDGTFTVSVNAIHLSEAQRLPQLFDIIFLAVKSYDTEWAAHFIKRFLMPSGIVVSSQNCMNDQLVASIVGYEREIGCVMSSISVGLSEPGHVIRGTPTGKSRGYDVFRVGELHGRSTKRVQELADILDCVDTARTTTNIWGERWSKLTINAAGNPVGAVTGLGSKGIASNPRARLLQVLICKESVLVGLAHNYDIEPIQGVSAKIWAKADEGDVFEELEALFHPKPNGGDWKSSMAQDVTKDRKTEIEFMNKYIVKRGREVNVPTPVNAAITEIVEAIESGDIQAHTSNVERVFKALKL